MPLPASYATAKRRRRETNLWRLGWTAGAGVETPFAPHWTARLEYLYTGYGARSVTFPAAAQVTADLGVFARAGWADGNLEPWDFTDIDGTVQAGVSFSGKQCGRPNDRVGIENEQIKAFAPHWEEGRIADRGSLAAHTHGFRIFIEPLGQ